MTNEKATTNESGRTMVQLVRRGEEHPYVIEVTTPGWRGVDAAFKGPIKLPDDIKAIDDLLNQAGVKRWKGTDGTGKAKLLFVNDGTTEIILEDAKDFELAIEVLTRAGWLSPELPLNAPTQ